MGSRTHKLKVDLGDALENVLETIARKKGTSVEDLLQERVIQEWLGKKRILNQHIFEEPPKRARRTKDRRAAPRPALKESPGEYSLFLGAISILSLSRNGP